MLCRRSSSADTGTTPRSSCPNPPILTPRAPSTRGIGRRSTSNGGVEGLSAGWGAGLALRVRQAIPPGRTAADQAIWAARPMDPLRPNRQALPLSEPDLPGHGPGVQTDPELPTNPELPTDPELPTLQEQLIVFARELGELYRLERSRNAELEMVLESLQDTYLATMKSLATVIEAKDQ